MWILQRSMKKTRNFLNFELFLWNVILKVLWWWNDQQLQCIKGNNHITPVEDRTCCQTKWSVKNVPFTQYIVEKENRVFKFVDLQHPNWEWFTNLKSLCIIGHQILLQNNRSYDGLKLIQNDKRSAYINMKIHCIIWYNQFMHNKLTMCNLCYMTLK